MNQTLPHYLEIIRGDVADLAVTRGEREFVQTANEHAAGAAAGLAGAATSALLATSASADPVEFFTASIGGKPVSGCFSRVGFENDHSVEAVVEKLRDGTHAVYAIRRPSDQTLWMFPHCSRGKRAHWKHALLMIPIVIVAIEAAVLIFFGSIGLFSDESHSIRSLSFFVALISANAVALGTYLPLRIASKWKPFIQIAERVFAALGYPDPSRVDMEKENRLFWKQNRSQKGRIYAPWVYRCNSPGA
ncbi:putative type VI secretion system effector [Niveibacterium sp. SC-1]|uniref:putative type VI secretion system effector n=1 Tax=Niveibacterium sp. SC-1 TaxID=3135646 RepID=UPI00311F1BE3